MDKKSTKNRKGICVSLKGGKCLREIFSGKCVPFLIALLFLVTLSDASQNFKLLAPPNDFNVDVPIVILILNDNPTKEYKYITAYSQTMRLYIVGLDGNVLQAYDTSGSGAITSLYTYLDEKREVTFVSGTFGFIRAYTITADGSVQKWRLPFSSVEPARVIYPTDLKNDGTKTLLIGTSKVYVMRIENETPYYWMHELGSGVSVYSLCAANLDETPFNEIIIGADKLYAVSVLETSENKTQGITLWKRDLNGTVNTVYSDTVGDSNEPSVAAGAGNTLYLVSQNGEILWSIPFDNPVKKVLIADIFGDGINDVLAASGDKIFMLDYKGNILDTIEFENTVNDFVAEDINRDGFTEIIAGSHKLYVYGLSPCIIATKKYHFLSDLKKYIDAGDCKNNYGLNFYKISRSAEYEYGIAGCADELDEIKKLHDACKSQMTDSPCGKIVSMIGDSRIALSSATNISGYEEVLDIADNITLLYDTMGDADKKKCDERVIESEKSNISSYVGSVINESNAAIWNINEHQKADNLYDEADKSYLSISKDCKRDARDSMMSRINEACEIYSNLNDSKGAEKCGALLSRYSTIPCQGGITIQEMLLIGFILSVMLFVFIALIIERRRSVVVGSSAQWKMYEERLEKKLALIESEMKESDKNRSQEERMLHTLSDKILQIAKERSDETEKLRSTRESLVQRENELKKERETLWKSIEVFKAKQKELMIRERGIDLLKLRLKSVEQEREEMHKREEEEIGALKMKKAQIESDLIEQVKKTTSEKEGALLEKKMVEMENERKKIENEKTELNRLRDELKSREKDLNEIDSIKNKLKEREKDLEVLTDKREEMLGVLKKKEEALVLKEKDLGIKEKETEEKEKRVASIIQDIDKKTSVLIKEKKDLESTKEELDKKKEELDKIRDGMKKREEEIEAERSKMQESFEKERSKNASVLSDLKSKLDSIEKERSKEKSRLTEIQEELDEKKEELRARDREKLEMEQEMLKKKESDRAKIEKTIKKKESDINEREKAIRDEMNKRQSELQNELDKIRNDLMSKDDYISALKKDTEARTDKMRMMEAEIESKRKILSLMESALKTKDARLKALEMDRKRMEEEFKKTSDMQAAQIEEYKKSLGGIEDEHRKQQEEITQLKELLKAKEKESGYEDRIDEIQKRIDEKEITLKEKEKNLIENINLADKDRNKLMNQQKELEKIRNELVEKESDWQKKENEVTERERELAERATELKKMKEVLTKQGEEMERRERSIEMIEEDLKHKREALMVADREKEKRSIELNKKVEECVRQIRGTPIIIRTPNEEEVHILENDFPSIREVIPLIDGTRTLDKLSDDASIDYSAMSGIMNELMQRGCITFVDPLGKIVYDLFGMDGVTVRNLVDGKNSIRDIINKSGVDKEKVAKIVHTLYDRTGKLKKIEVTHIDEIFANKNPLLVKKLDLIDKYKYESFSDLFRYLEWMDGTKSLSQIAEEGGIDVGRLQDLVKQFMEEDYIFVVDRKGLRIYERLGAEGIKVYNLIDEKHSIREIISESKLDEKEVMKMLAEINKLLSEL